MRRNDLKAIAAYKDVHTGLLLALAGVWELTMSIRAEPPMPVYHPALLKAGVRICKAMRKLVTFNVDNQLETEEHVLEVHKFEIAHVTDDDKQDLTDPVR